MGLVMVLLFWGCVQKAPLSMFGNIGDIERLSQDPLNHLQEADQNRFFMDRLLQDESVNGYEKRFFRPWDLEKPLDSKQAFWGVGLLKKERVFGETNRMLSDSDREKIVHNVNRAAYPNRNQKAVTVRNTHLRAMPAHKPLFYDPALPGEGYPFDYFQNSALHAGTPLWVTHQSHDLAWLHVEAPFASGWVRQQDAAYADESFQNTYRTAPLATPIRDDLTLSSDGEYLGTVKIGALYPIEEPDGQGLTLLIPAKDENHNAVWRRATVTDSDFAAFPLKATYRNLSEIAGGILGENYGWGGMYFNRDCSSFLRDIFTPFGIWLPRNSLAQAKNAGTFIPMEGLSPEEKKTLISEAAEPYLTLLWMPGHIMLYLGDYGDEMRIMHDFWGVRTRDLLGNEGRHVVGKAAITTLRPGAELPDFDSEKGDWLNRIQGMTLLNPEK